jgi:hypothetical protein
VPTLVCVKDYPGLPLKKGLPRFMSRDGRIATSATTHYDTQGIGYDEIAYARRRPLVRLTKTLGSKV